jgi:hypothetical protein
MTQEVIQFPIEKLIEYARNPRKNDHAVDSIAAAIREFGFRVPILAKSDGTVIDGHLRLKAAKKLSMENVPVLFADDMTPTQIKAFRLSVNKMADLADWDYDFLAVEIDELNDEGFDLDLLGFSKDELNELIGTPDTVEGLTDPDDVSEPPEEPVTKLGDVWLLGKHRLMCGDSTSIDAVERLMDGQKASLVVTDPPWNVAYGTNLANNAQGYKPRTILNDSMDADKWEEFLHGVVASIVIATMPGTPLYCVMGASEWPAIDKALRGGGVPLVINDYMGKGLTCVKP